MLSNVRSIYNGFSHPGDHATIEILSTVETCVGNWLGSHGMLTLAPKPTWIGMAPNPSPPFANIPTQGKYRQDPSRYSDIKLPR